MKNLLILLTFSFCFFTLSAQEYADFEITGTNEGTGTFINAALPNFTWVATGTINGEVQILDDEVFDDGNAFENTFGQADNAENLRTQIYPNGQGTVGQPILSKSKLTINFNEVSPVDGWGFCIVDIDVENCLISAIDENDNEVSVEDIDGWLIELFDTYLITDGLNIPKWDPAHAAILGFTTPDDYIVYNNLVIGGLDDSEAPAAFFMPHIPLKSLIIDHENLQDDAYVSFHFYIASMAASAINDHIDIDVNMYPNPAKEYIDIKCPQLANNSGMITILDLTGKQLFESQIIFGESFKQVDISRLQRGVYFCRITINDQIITKKIIKQ
jgi:hypothetical protein